MTAPLVQTAPGARKGTGGRPTLEASAALADAILDTAWRLFVDGGYRNLSVDTIAREASVSKRTLYDRFGSKEGLFEALVMRASTRWSVQAQGVYEGQRKGDWLRPLIRHLLELMGGADFLALSSFMITEGRAFPQVMDLQRRMSDGSIQALAGHLSSRVDRYPAGEAGLLLAQSVLALTSGWARSLAQAGRPVDAAISDRVDQEVRALLALHGCSLSDGTGPV